MAGYLAGDVDKWIYIDIQDQHTDSIRFIKDCEKAIGKEIEILRSKEYRSVEECVRVFGGFRNPANGFAPCTNWLKKRVRKEWEEQHKENYMKKHIHFTMLVVMRIWMRSHLELTIQVITDNGEKTIWNVVDIALLKLEEM